MDEENKDSDEVYTYRANSRLLTINGKTYGLPGHHQTKLDDYLAGHCHFRSPPKSKLIYPDGVQNNSEPKGAANTHWLWRSIVMESTPTKTNHMEPDKHYHAEIDIDQRTLEFVNADVSLSYEYQQKPTKQNWTAYNAAQTSEIELFDQLLLKLVEVVDEPEQKIGRPRLPLRDQLFCAIQKVYSQLSSRRAAGLYKNAESRDQVSHAPHFNAPSKTMNKQEITPTLHQLVRISAAPLSGIETDFAVDSSGFRTTSFNNYCDSKHGTKKEHTWLKAHISCGVFTNVVADVVITGGHGADVSQFQSLLTGTNGFFHINEVSADKAYSSRANHNCVEDIGASAYIPFRKNATGRAGRSAAWKRAFHFFQMHQDEFYAHYHKRSNVESTFAAIKQKFGETLKSKNEVAQINELLCKIIAYNITVLIHEMYEHDIQPDFLHLKSAACT